MALQRTVIAEVTFSSVLFCIFNSLPIRRPVAGSGGFLTWNLEGWRPLDYLGGQKGLLGSMSMSVQSLCHILRQRCLGHGWLDKSRVQGTARLEIDAWSCHSMGGI